MNIFITGKYTPSYNRNAVLISGLSKREEIVLMEYPYPSKRKADKKKLEEGTKWADVVFLPSFTHRDVRFIRKRTTKPLVFDPLISRYLSKVFDYKSVWRYSPRALKNYLKDVIAFRHSDLIFADTLQHKSYYMQQFGIEEHRIKVLYVGVNSADCMTWSEPPAQPFRLGFYGHFIPLQGTRKIIEAARILKHEDIDFEMIGTGFEYQEVYKLATSTYKLKNIRFAGQLPYQTLLSSLKHYHACLGIFGDTAKANLVIPNKVYHYAGMCKAIITKDTPAIREVFTPDHNILLCSSDPEAIAQHILKLRTDEQLREMLAKNAFALVTEKYNETCIAQTFVEAVRPLLNLKG